MKRYSPMKRYSSFSIFLLALAIQSGAIIAQSAPANKAAQLKAEQAEAIAVLAVPDISAMRNAITFLQTTYGNRYPRGAEFLSRLAALEKTPDAAGLAALQKEALIANPLVSGQPILFATHYQYKADHHNTETMFQTNEINTGKFQGGGALRVIDFAKGGEVRTLVDPGKEGVARDPEVSFDGRKVLFSMRRNIQEDYHIYEVKADGSGLKQLTSAPGVFDINPFYLPDNAIAFTSSREPKYCMCNRHIMGNLYRMEPDGANIVQIGKNTLFEGHGSLLPDGRILYDRWEYVDRDFGDAQGLWTMNPDGTTHAIYYKNNTGSPGGAIEGRNVPGTSTVVCTFTSCHDRPWGAIALVDRSKGVDGRAPVVRTWPAKSVDLVNEKGSFDSFKAVYPKYENPYPLSEKFILCSRMTGQGEQMGIYLLDVFGNELLLHTEDPGCFNPVPLAARPRPPVIPTRRDYGEGNGTFYIQNVYQGTHMKDVKPGSVKYLRVVEEGEKRSWSSQGWKGQGQEAPAMNWHDFSNKRIHGTVPVEADGSANFIVPSGKFIFFQLLDENKMMIQSMRSATTIQPNETQSCTGCHEDRLQAPTNAPHASLALKRAPSTMDGWHGPARFFNYRTEVQPVFDKHCVSCHDYGKEAGKSLNLAGDRGLAFNASYLDLWKNKYVKLIGGGPAPIQPAYSWGSHASRLTKTLEAGHYGVKLSEEERERVITWMDINGPYYPDFLCANPNNRYGRSPLTEAQLKQLADLGVDLKMSESATQISFDRPELSPGLAVFPDHNDPKYIRALAIIQEGKEALTKNPESDAAGFKPCPADVARNAKYEAQMKLEQRNREAISNGKKVYDAPSAIDKPSAIKGPKEADTPSAIKGPKEADTPSAIKGPKVTHRFLKSGSHAKSMAIVGKDGTVEWEYPTPTECNEAWLLPNGNVFFTFVGGVREVKPDQSKVWEFLAPKGSQIQGCQPLGDNRFLVAESRPDGVTVLREMDRTGKIFKTVEIKMGGGGSAHDQVRQIRKTPQGTYLACQQRARGHAMEFDAEGKVLRTFVSGCFVAERLPNGNTLISCGGDHRVIEVDPQDKIVWEVNQNDIPGNTLAFVAGIVRLANGNTVICNWEGHGGVEGQPSVFEVTPEKRVVWEVRDPIMELTSCIRILDEETLTPAIPSK